MKNRIINIRTIGLLLMAIFASCYDDKSTLPSVEFPDVVVDRSDEGDYLIANYGEQFTYEPKLGRLVGRDTIWLSTSELEEFTYVWKMTLAAGTDTVARAISHDRILDVVMAFAPNTGSYNYSLMLQIVHQTSGVTKQINWEIKVLGVYGSGLLIADTKDEQTTDISLLMSRSFNYDIDNYEKDVAYYDIYSKANDGNKMGGLVSSMAYLASSEGDVLTAIVKGKSLIQIDPVTMKENARDMSLFYYQPIAFNPQSVVSLLGCSILVNDGVFHFYNAFYGKVYSHTPEFEYKLSTICIPYSGSSCNALFFDERGSKFVRFTKNGKNHMIDLPTTTGGVFDLTNMQSVEPIYGDRGTSSTGRCLVKRDGKYFIYEIARQTFIGSKIYDLKNCTDLDKATCYAFSEAYNEFYYGVDDKLYVVILNTDVPVCHPAYDRFGENEVITHVLMHKGDGLTTWNEKPDGTSQWTDSENNLLSVATYNTLTKEGKIYTLPIQYGGDGGIAADKYVRTYGRFGRITSIVTR